MKIYITCNAVKVERNGEQGIGMQLTIAGLTEEESLWFGDKLHKPVIEWIDELHRKRGTAASYVDVDLQEKTVQQITRGDKKDAN